VLVRVGLADDGEEVASRERAWGRHRGGHLRAYRQRLVLVVVHRRRRRRRDCRPLAQCSARNRPLRTNTPLGMAGSRRDQTAARAPRGLRGSPTRRRLLNPGAPSRSPSGTPRNPDRDGRPGVHEGARTAGAHVICIASKQPGWTTTGASAV
jgi:hypothetical protein